MNHWKKLLMIVYATILAGSAGCQFGGTKTVLVPPGSPVRIREDVSAKVWVRDDKGGWLESEAKIPAGWFALPEPVENPPLGVGR